MSTIATRLTLATSMSMTAAKCRTTKRTTRKKSRRKKRSAHVDKQSLKLSTTARCSLFGFFFRVLAETLMLLKNWWRAIC